MKQTRVQRAAIGCAVVFVVLLLVKGGESVPVSVGREGLQDPEPRGWAQSWFAVLSRNCTNPTTGLQRPFEAHLKWYDWGLQALRDECTTQGITSTFLALGTSSYIFADATRECVYVRLPVGPVTPGWMFGGAYVGQQTINSVPSNVWIKLDHLYAEALTDGRTTRVISPFDQKGDTVQDDYGLFFEGPQDRALFTPPSYCANAPRFDSLAHLASVASYKNSFVCYLP
eukprot:TRINITY_DN17348_c0_g1_i1.p1 TRINITY_DN17348_c0_g1~~TRINITY_DN17348_c0_g1_i1.p1  ORF type:complete len:228 (+),score=24.96 TRINITY_DN17348_c0_g1_i1:69-752(+)